jgi:hypothetical protein
VPFVVDAIGVLHKRSEMEFAKATRSQKKDLARCWRNVVGIALHGSYQIFHESMKKTRYNRTNPPIAEVLADIERQETDRMPDGDDDMIDIEVDPNEGVTGIELYQVSVMVREVAKEEEQPLPDLEERLDGHKDPEKPEALQRNLDRFQVIKHASHVHECFAVMEPTGEYKSRPVIKRSISAKGMDTLGSYHIAPAQVKITLCIGGNRDNQILVSERTWMDDLRRIMSTHFQGRCCAQPDQFPPQDGTAVLVISMSSTINMVVPYMVHDGHKRPIEIAPETLMTCLS